MNRLLTNAPSCPEYSGDVQAVALEGDTAMIGAYDQGSPKTTPGAVYVFTRSGSTWTQVQKLTPSDGLVGYGFGFSLALQGDEAFIGAPNGGARSVYVFTRTAGTWTEHARLTPSAGAWAGDFGYDVAVAGDTLLVGVPSHWLNFGAGYNNYGGVYEFVRNGTHGTTCGQEWCEKALLGSSDLDLGDWFGAKVALDGDVAMITALYDDEHGPGGVPGHCDSGSVYVFTRTGSAWTEAQKLIASDGFCGPPESPNTGQRFGWDLVIQADTALIGAFNDDDLGFHSGSVYLYTQSAGTWAFQTKLTASDGAAYDIYGIGIALDGETVLIGAAGSGGPGSLLNYPGAAYISAIALNQPPVADAGDSQSLHVGVTVELDGSGSNDDNTPTEELVYAWEFTTRPTGSAATLIGADTIAPTFVPDLPGDYVVSLVVTDEGGLDSEPDDVTISSENAPPNADAGPDQGAYTGALVILDGSASSDPDGDPLSYEWMITSAPTGSLATLTNPDTVAPSFDADLAGAYVIELIVSDGYAYSEPDSAEIVVAEADDYVCTLMTEALNRVAAMDASSFGNKGNRVSLQNFLKNACKFVQKGDLSGAQHKLEQAAERTDGCALRGVPDEGGGGQGPMKDSIIICTDQDAVYPLIDEALDALMP